MAAAYPFTNLRFVPCGGSATPRVRSAMTAVTFAGGSDLCHRSKRSISVSDAACARSVMATSTGLPVDPDDSLTRTPP